MNAQMNVYARIGQRKTMIQKKRTERGEVIAEGAATAVFLMTLTTALVLLVMEIGKAGYYMQRLNFVAEQVAGYAASLPSNSDVSGEADAMLKQLASQCGIPGGNYYAAEVDPITVGGKSAVKVTMRYTGPSTNGFFLQDMRLIATSAVAVRPANAPNDGYLAIRARTGGSVGIAYVPIRMVAPYAPPSVDGHQDVHYPSQATPPGYNPQTTYSINDHTNAVGQPSGNYGAYSPAAL